MTSDEACEIALKYVNSQGYEHYGVHKSYFESEAERTDKRRGSNWKVWVNTTENELVISSHPFLFVVIEESTGEVYVQEIMRKILLGNYLSDIWD